MTDLIERGPRFSLDELEGMWVAFFDRYSRERIGRVVGRVGQQAVRVKTPTGEVVRVERDRLLRYASGPSAFASPMPGKRAVPSIWLNGYGARRAPRMMGFAAPHITCTCGGDHSAVERDIRLPDGRGIQYWACPTAPPITRRGAAAGGASGVPAAARMGGGVMPRIHRWGWMTIDGQMIFEALPGFPEGRYEKILTGEIRRVEHDDKTRLRLHEGIIATWEEVS